MTEQTIFDGSTTPDGEAAKSAITLPDSVKDLIGEGKKYASVEKALEALVHAQSHIATLEGETRTLRERVQGASSTEDVVRTVQELLAAERAKTGVATVVDEAAISGLLDRKLTERETMLVKASNVETVKKALVEKYGDKADEVYRARAKELGVGVAFLNDAAATSPVAAFELLGLGKPSTAASAGTMHSRGTVRTESLESNRTDAPRKSVMSGATTKDMVNEWNRHKPQ